MVSTNPQLLTRNLRRLWNGRTLNRARLALTKAEAGSRQVYVRHPGGGGARIWKLEA